MLLDANQIVRAAHDGHYAVGAFTIYNLEWANAVLFAAQDLDSPVILGVSEASADYMGGFIAVSAMVRGILESRRITVPVALHLDHGSYDGARACLQAGFTSVMYDGSHDPLAENLNKTASLVQAAHRLGISVEAEVGAIAGVEDSNVTVNGEIADPKVCAAMADTGIDFLAAGIGNIHGVYPKDWKGLDFAALSAIAKATGNIPLVLHGGTGIPPQQIRQAISMGVAKINVNTECQQGWAKGLRDFITANRDLEPRGHDPRLLMAQARENLYNVVCEKLRLFGSVGRAGDVRVP